MRMEFLLQFYACKRYPIINIFNRILEDSISGQPDIHIEGVPVTKTYFLEPFWDCDSGDVGKPFLVSYFHLLFLTPIILFSQLKLCRLTSFPHSISYSSIGH